jgi:hypothetical protein
MARSTNQDAMVMLQLATLGAQQGVSAALNWVLSDEFTPDYAEFVKKFPRGSDGYGKARMLLGHYETIGTLWKHRLINEDLLFDWLWVEGVWNRLQGFVLGTREAAGNPALGENFEAMVRAAREWKLSRGKRLQRRRSKAR